MYEDSTHIFDIVSVCNTCYVHWTSRITMEALFYSAIVMFTLISLNLSVVLREYPVVLLFYTIITLTLDITTYFI